MKIRNDFVTNSSSSSFILEKGWSADDAFKVLTDWCKDYDKRMDQAIEYIKAQGYEVDSSLDTYYMHITPFDGNYRQVLHEVEEKFKISTLYSRLPDFITDVASCKNYAEYIQKNQENNKANRFEIKTMTEICKEHTNDWDIYSDLIGWYVDDEEDPIDIDEFLEKTKDSVVLYAEDPGISYYPEFVLDELRDMSLFSCSHMG